MIRVRNIKVNIENDNNSILTDKVSKILHVNHKDILNIVALHPYGISK